MDTPCFDDPEVLADPEACITALSKSTDEGTIKSTREFETRCQDPACVTLILEQTLDLPLKSGDPCDGPVALLLGGHIRVEQLVTASEPARIARGVHAGDLVWKTQTQDVLVGRMSGISNAGLVRTPLKHPIEDCVAAGVLTGRLCAHVAETRNPTLRGVQVVATYRIEMVSPTNFHATFEGVVVSPCRKR